MPDRLIVAKSCYPHLVELLADDWQEAVNDPIEAEQAIGSLLANLTDLEFDESFINAVLDLISDQTNGA